MENPPENLQENPWTTLSTKKIYETPWIRIVEHECLNPHKKPASYGVVEFKNLAVGVLAIDDQDQITLVGQWRYPLEKYSWEIPEGGAGLGLDPQAEMQRELKEETGLTARTWSKLFEMYLSNSSTNERAVIYLAKDLIEGDSAPEETEILKVKKVTLKAAYRMVEIGEITDAISVAAIQRCYIDELQRSANANK